jgi:hypothetical protein
LDDFVRVLDVLDLPLHKVVRLVEIGLEFLDAALLLGERVFQLSYAIFRCRHGVCKLSAFQHTSMQDLWAFLRLSWCCSGRCRVITRPRNAISKRRTAISFRMSVLNPTAAASIASSALRATTRPIHLAPAAARYTSHALRRTGFAPGFVVVRWSFWFRHSAGKPARATLPVT